jgi:hypothetical protein
VGQDELANGAVIGESVHAVADSEDEHARGRVQAVSLGSAVLVPVMSPRL